MSRLLVCLVLALTSFVCVESREMFHDAISSKVFAKVLVKDSKGNCKKEEMKHQVAQWTTNCATLAAAVGAGVACAATAAATFKSFVDSYIDKECARLGHVASGLEKMKKVMPKVNTVNAFKANNPRNKYVEIHTSRNLRRRL
ncbi:unnamed protein product [Aphanomyces euteiches]|uniref:Uncharacterized protein n=1 Tax=Aphanomyces euteiches TaxID=100861 RepID=A0A6G0WFM1_9STRA|nr:hypothetical protein Ae201684_016274 [Aphanomyces euteiches]KAH9152071.1 hypothetical protein AeRB84_005448 [Aphanomyces euteiches]